MNLMKPTAKGPSAEASPPTPAWPLRVQTERLNGSGGRNRSHGLHPAAPHRFPGREEASMQYV